METVRVIGRLRRAVDTNAARSAMLVAVIGLVMWSALPCAFAATVQYSYDSLGRLTAAAYGNGTTVTYTYDPAGNLLSRTTAAAAAQVTLAKSFSPASITAGDTSKLTITLGNPNATAANLTATLSDVLPTNLVIATPLEANTTCTGTGAIVAQAGGGTIVVPAGRSIPANGSCEVTVNVTSNASTSYINSLAAGALTTDMGSNVAAASATLYVVSTSGNRQGLWWKADESGWGISLSQQGGTIWARWFTYGPDGKPLWLAVAMTESATNAVVVPNVYSGRVFTATGPAFDAVPFDWKPSMATEVGTASFTFADDGHASFDYAIYGISQTKQVTRQVFASPVPTCSLGTPAEQVAATNYQDSWWVSPAGFEDGWGLEIQQQGDTIFAQWFTYGHDGKPLWLVMAAPKVAPSEYSGTIVKPVSGPPFNTVPFLFADVVGVPAGKVTLTFADGNHATFAYTLDGVAQTKQMTRQQYGATATVCR